MKWLCQNSVIRSTSGWSVTSISSTHQLRSSRPCSCTGRTTCSGLPSTPLLSLGGLLRRAELGRTFIHPRRRRRQRLRPEVAEQPVDRRGVVERLDGADLGRRRAEGRARQEMTRLVEAHGEAARPGRGAHSAAGKCGRAAHETTSTEMQRSWRLSYCGGRPRTGARPPGRQACAAICGHANRSARICVQCVRAARAVSFGDSWAMARRFSFCCSARSRVIWSTSGSILRHVELRGF